MKKSYFLLILLIGLNPAKAHEFLSEILVYSDEYDMSEYEIMAHFVLDQNEIRNMVEINRIYQNMKRLRDRPDPLAHIGNKAESPGTCGPGNTSKQGNKTCGVIDPFMKGRSLALGACHAHAVANLYTFNLVPQFIAPQSFIDLDSTSNNHHVNYDFSQGLEFNCVKVVESNSNNTLTTKH